MRRFEPKIVYKLHRAFEKYPQSILAAGDFLTNVNRLTDLVHSMIITSQIVIFFAILVGCSELNCPIYRNYVIPSVIPNIKFSSRTICTHIQLLFLTSSIILNLFSDIATILTVGKLAPSSHNTMKSSVVILTFLIISVITRAQCQVDDDDKSYFELGQSYDGNRKFYTLNV